MELTLNCLGYNIRMGDSLLSIAERFAPDKSPAGIQAYLAELDRYGALRDMGADITRPDLPIPRPYAGICLPADSKAHPDKEALYRAASHINYGNRKPYALRRVVNQFVNYDYDLTTIASIGLIMGAFQRTNQFDKLEKVGANVAVSTLIALPEQLADHAKDRAKHLQVKLDSLQKKVNSYITASKEERINIKAGFLTEFKAMNEQFNADINHLSKIQRFNSKKILLTDANKIFNKSVDGRPKNREKQLIASESYRTLAGVAKYAKVVR